MHSADFDFPSAFRAARLEQRLTLAEAAAKCGVSRRLVAYWEAGERMPPPEDLAVTQQSMVRAVAARPLSTEDGRTLRLS